MLKSRNLVQPEDFSIKEIDEILDLAQQIMANPDKYSEVCKGKLLATLFYEPSTRTRLSFESAMKLLPRGGYLATASCSHFATEELFIKMLKAAAKDAHRQLRQIEVKQQAPDHPILWGVPETNYLKFFLFQVI